MVPPIWLDEFGKRRPSRPCPSCGREIAVFERMRIEDVRRVGWQLFAPMSYVEWCGHGQEVIVLSQHDGWCHLVPVLGEAS